MISLFAPVLERGPVGRMSAAVEYPVSLAVEAFARSRSPRSACCCCGTAWRNSVRSSWRRR
ncbi:hypothetical protein [Nocardia caishijiensis]|uniref:hypothetical protein n=1 Tax=Nocardia caishijiensis TaxID=184756 RepID=UPI0008361C5D|nr:hypothetical protein [Nocardia caishijiensis]